MKGPASCEHCGQAGTFVRVRYFDFSLSLVWCCRTAACPAFNSYFHSEHRHKATLADVTQWATSIAESQGTATEEEERIAAAIRQPEQRLRPLSEWGCFKAHGAKHGPFPWLGMIEGPDGYQMHADNKTFEGLAASFAAAAKDKADSDALFAPSDQLLP